MRVYQTEEGFGTPQGYGNAWRTGEHASDLFGDAVPPLSAASDRMNVFKAIYFAILGALGVNCP